MSRASNDLFNPTPEHLALREMVRGFAGGLAGWSHRATKAMRSRSARRSSPSSATSACSASVRATERAPGRREHRQIAAVIARARPSMPGFTLAYLAARCCSPRWPRPERQRPAAASSSSPAWSRSHHRGMAMSGAVRRRRAGTRHAGAAVAEAMTFVADEDVDHQRCDRRETSPLTWCFPPSKLAVRPCVIACLTFCDREG